LTKYSGCTKRSLFAAVLGYQTSTLQCSSQKIKLEEQLIVTGLPVSDAVKFRQLSVLCLVYQKVIVYSAAVFLRLHSSMLDM
jgi:hypothetical protein